MSLETMDFDVVIVGAGPAGLSAAIRLKQLAQQHTHDLSVCIVEKGSQVGAHILSGAVLEPRALTELLPNWQDLDAPIKTPVTCDRFLYLTKRRAWRLPTPQPMRNHGNYIISLGQLCRWLAQHAETLGVEIYPGFAAVDFLYDDQQHVNGIITGSMGLDKTGQQTPQYQPGIALRAKQTLLAEGCHGSLSQHIMSRYQLRAHAQPQSYGIGIKELWEVDPSVHQPGLVIHTIGWPLDRATYGGSFIYHWDENLVSVGFVIGLDYQNPFINPFEELQRFKTHPRIRPMFENGKRICYGARALNEGGWQALPQLTFPGGSLIGDSAGFLNVPKIKGSHTAMKSGLLAAETVFNACQHGDPSGQRLTTYEKTIRESWLGRELHRVRNIRPAFHWGLWRGLTYAALDTYLFRGHAPWTLRYRQADHECLKPAKNFTPINYPAPDGKITFDRLSSVFLSNTYHQENQPCHLQLQDKNIPIQVNLAQYDAPEQRYCPASVYEIVYNVDRRPVLQINAQNCVHCKTCDIKDPRQNIRWVPPQGGEGPNYPNM